MKRRAVALLLLAAAGCGVKPDPARIPEGDGPIVATYRAEFSRAGEPTRRTRLLLWAERPDRLHAELLPPAGGSPMTLDAGSGRAVLVDSSQGLAYVGDAGPEAIASLTGVRLGVAEMVSALLDASAPAGAEIEREGQGRGVLPSRLRVSRDGARITLTLLRWERAAADPATLGTGNPPEGLAVRPLSSWGEPR